MKLCRKEELIAALEKLPAGTTIWVWGRKGMAVSPVNSLELVTKTLVGEQEDPPRTTNDAYLESK
jgi:hypothetical protein